MAVAGRIESVWRYPVKSMAGEALEQAFVGFAGLHGDRLYAFCNPKSPAGFPYQTGRENRQMLRYRPQFRAGAASALPAGWAAAQSLDPVLAAPPTDTADLALDVVTPEGRTLAIDDPALAAELGENLTLARSEKAITDCRPVSLISLQTAAKVGEEAGRAVDVRRFRANLVLDLGDAEGFAEDGFVGRILKIGGEVTMQVVERDPRCAMVTLDPDTAERDFDVLKAVSSGHDGKAGVYAAVLTEGIVRPGDAVELL